jgi:GTP-binding protein YchF
MLRAGLIGLPACGKTTLFQLLTSAREAARVAGRVEANVGVSRVPDDRLDRLTSLFQPERRVPATVEFADVAAGRGDAKGLLDVAAYRNADALLHVVRAFADPAVPHDGPIDPARDVRRMEDELVLADLGVAEKRLDRLERDLRKSHAPELKLEQDVLVRCREALEGGRPLRTVALAGDETKRVRGFQFLSAKPLLVVVNLDEADVGHASGGASHAPGLDTLIEQLGARSVDVCAKIELEIAQLDPADAAVFMTDLGLAESGLDRVIHAAYGLLGYISFFTVGEDECRAWSIPRGTPAQAAAGAVHTDIERGFIRAEVVPCDRLLARGSLAACREHGELRLEGKDYPVADGDVIVFRFAT